MKTMKARRPKKVMKVMKAMKPKTTMKVRKATKALKSMKAMKAMKAMTPKEATKAMEAETEEDLWGLLANDPTSDDEVTKEYYPLPDLTWKDYVSRLAYCR